MTKTEMCSEGDSREPRWSAFPAPAEHSPSGSSATPPSAPLCSFRLTALGVNHWLSLQGLMLVREEAANQRGLAPPTQPAPGGVVAALPPHAGNCSLMRPSCLGRKEIKNYSTQEAERGAVPLLGILYEKPAG